MPHVTTKAELFSPLLPPNKDEPVCLTMSYFIFGNADVRLYVHTAYIDNNGTKQNEVTVVFIMNFSADGWKVLSRTLESQSYDYKVS